MDATIGSATIDLGHAAGVRGRGTSCSSMYFIPSSSSRTQGSDLDMPQRGVAGEFGHADDHDPAHGRAAQSRCGDRSDRGCRFQPSTVDVKADANRGRGIFPMPNVASENVRMSAGDLNPRPRSEDLFKREYPLTPDEAFMASNFDSFITNDLVMRARKEEIEPHGPLIVGVDPAGKGADFTAIAWRRGHCIVKTERCRGLDTMEVAGWVAQIIREDKPAKVNIDVGGLGIGVYDRLIEQGHDSGVVTAVNFGGKPIEPPPPDEAGKPGGRPANRRAELWSRRWLQ